MDWIKSFSFFRTFDRIHENRVVENRQSCNPRSHSAERRTKKSALKLEAGSSATLTRGFHLPQSSRSLWQRVFVGTKICFSFEIQIFFCKYFSFFFNANFFYYCSHTNYFLFQVLIIMVGHNQMGPNLCPAPGGLPKTSLRLLLWNISNRIPSIQEFILQIPRNIASKFESFT